ncbi:DNA repair protein [Roseovarius sp. A46]|uniref:DNA repair protein n=1 Tax=Roseovarius sp. A46 TaxID=2109331 RepID=UPI001011EFA9|nr:DNA repair protein [Roseovarius sp. A46]RXV66589.1 DNA repair protein [Roseovarius sp. A46]
MFTQVKSVLALIGALFQRLAAIILVLSALALVAATTAAAVGALPWLEFEVTFGGETYANAGHIAQIGVTVLAVLLCFYLPSNARIMALETSHRRFDIGMQDIARAYHAAHAADREGVFHLSSEFDAVRERLAWLREHPDLGGLEPGLLEVAAQMSHISQELADVYSEEKVARARQFLHQRQEEVAAFNDRIERAKAVSQELRHWAHEVELEESVAASQLARLREDLLAVLPELGIEEVLRADGTVIDIPRKAAE